LSAADLEVIRTAVREADPPQRAEIARRVPIPPKLDSHSSANWTPDPPQTGRLFQVKLDSRSEATRGG